MPSRLKLRHAAIVMAAGLVLAFQNCTDKLQNPQQDVLSSYMSKLPFAYHAQMDTVAYMSCSRAAEAHDQKTYFTFRLGAYDGQGLGLTDEYLDATKYYTTANRAWSLSQSTLNASARLQLSIRSTSDYQAVLSGHGSALNPGQELGDFLGALDQDPVATQLASLGQNQYKSYFAGSLASRQLASSLDFSDADESTQLDIRTKLTNSQALLATTYTMTNSVADPQARGPAGATSTDVYGKGYVVKFQMPNGWASAETRTLQSVTEIDMQTGTPVTNGYWQCPLDYQFVIVRPEDEATEKCAETVDSYNSPAQQAELEAIRRVLPAEDWYVDLNYRCVVPKTSTKDVCYGDRTGRPAINYGYYNNTCSGDSCPHYVSVCIWHSLN